MVSHKVLESIFDRLWPICRSITGKGYRDSLEIISEYIPFKIIKFKSGKNVHDWKIPKEWVINDAYIKDPSGKKIIDFKSNNLHLVNYSIPFKGALNLEDLKEHLHTLPDQPNAIPYVTSYYREKWGFCVKYDEYKKLKNGNYEIFIDSSFEDGNLEVGEYILKGKSKKEIFFSTYLCHPSMANNELSGPLSMINLYQEISKIKNRYYTYRFVILPETIGSIAYLSKKGNELKKNIVAGYVLTCTGGSGSLTYKRSKQGDSLSDRAAIAVHRDLDKFNELKFEPFGSDERQYCSPGYNLPIGCLMRDMWGEYKEYHTSLDNKDFVNLPLLKKTNEIYMQIIALLENNFTYQSEIIYGEPKLDKRNLYPESGGLYLNSQVKALKWLISYCDGSNDLIDISKISGHKIKDILGAAEVGFKSKLLKIVKRNHKQ